MAAIYRFGFEHERTPVGVTPSNRVYNAGRTPGTRALTSSSYSEATYRLKSNSRVSIDAIVSGNYISAGYFCWVIGTVYAGSSDYVLASYAGNSVGISKSELWIHTAGGVDYRVGRGDFVGHTMVSGTHYYVVVEFNLGSSGSILLRWDGMEIEYEGDTGPLPTGQQTLTLQSPSFSNTWISESSNTGHYVGCSGFIDDVAINDGTGDKDNGIPDAIVCLPQDTLTVTENADWVPADAEAAAAALMSGNSVSSKVTGSVLRIGYTDAWEGVSRSTFEGVNVYVSGLKKSGRGKVGLQYGWTDSGSDFEAGDQVNLSYTATARSFSVLYANNSMVTTPSSPTKFTLETGSAFALYFKVV